MRNKAEDNLLGRPLNTSLSYDLSGCSVPELDPNLRVLPLMKSRSQTIVNPHPRSWPVDPAKQYQQAPAHHGNPAEPRPAFDMEQVRTLHTEAPPLPRDYAQHFQTRHHSHQRRLRTDCMVG